MIAYRIGRAVVWADRLSKELAHELGPERAQPIEYGANIASVFANRFEPGAEQIEMKTRPKMCYSAVADPSQRTLIQLGDLQFNVHRPYEDFIPHFDLGYQNGRIHVRFMVFLDEATKEPYTIEIDLDQKGIVSGTGNSRFEPFVKVQDVKKQAEFLVDIRGLFFEDLYDLMGDPNVAMSEKLKQLDETYARGPHLRVRKLNPGNAADFSNTEYEVDFFKDSAEYRVRGSSPGAGCSDAGQANPFDHKIDNLTRLFSGDDLCGELR